VKSAVRVSSRRAGQRFFSERDVVVGIEKIELSRITWVGIVGAEQRDELPLIARPDEPGEVLEAFPDG
jgi:hypothetical protein